MANKKQNQEPEIIEEVVEQEPKAEEPKEIQNEGKSSFPAKKHEGGTRLD